MIEALRPKLASKEPILGTFSLIPSADVIELIALAGFDVVIVDMEHGSYDLGTARAAVGAAQGRAMPAIVRVPRLDPAMIGAALDLGADGILVPQVSSGDDARSVVRAARFAPDGSRGANPYVRGTGYGSIPDWPARANERTAVMVMVEGTDGISAVPQILDTPGLDAVFLGPVDLSHALGLPGQPGHPRVLSALESVADQAAARGVATAVFAPDPRAAQTWWEHGVQMVACGADTDLIRGCLARTVAEACPELRPAATRT